MCNCKQNEYELLPELEAIVRNYAVGYDREYETPGGASRSFVTNFSGPAAECTAALTRAGKTQAQALAIINTQIALAIRMLRVAADKLKQGNRTATTNRIFQRIFRVPPSFVPTWLTPSATIKDRGDVVAVRCSRVADLLASGRIRFFCQTTAANCPDCGDDNSDFACSSWGAHNVICLGAPFWEDMKNGRLTSLLSTLMHEPFHIYFGQYVTEHGTHPDGSSVGKFGGIYCIVQFVFQINSKTAAPRVRSRCRAVPVRR